MESTIADEAKRFVSVVANERGSPVCINGLINKAVDNDFLFSAKLAICFSYIMVRTRYILMR
jgi:hypothetical protein